MNIYTMDCGCIVVVANNEDEAREIMKNYENYDSKRKIVEHLIQHGWSYANYGDM